MKTTTHPKNTVSSSFSLRSTKAAVAVMMLAGSLLMSESRAQSLVGTQPQNFGNFINWESLESGGLDAGKITSLSGQTLSLDNLGGYFMGNTVNVRVVTDGLLTITNNPALSGYQAMHLRLQEGQIANLYYAFTNPLFARQFAGGVVAPSERISYASNGTAINSGALLDQGSLAAAGFDVTDDSLFNDTPNEMITGAGVRWQANVEATSYVTTFENVDNGGVDAELATIFTLSVGQVPEPSGVALLSMGALSFLLRRKK